MPNRIERCIRNISIIAEEADTALVIRKIQRWEKEEDKIASDTSLTAEERVLRAAMTSPSELYGEDRSAEELRGTMQYPGLISVPRPLLWALKLFPHNPVINTPFWNITPH